MSRSLLALVVMLAPTVLAATDPSGDVVPCPHVHAVVDAGVETGAPDLVEASGDVVEFGTSVRFTLRFAEPLIVPDEEGKPFRVDIVLFDPDVPAVDAGLYRGVNRILRYDAVRDPVTSTILVPEAGQSRFIPPTIDGATLVMQVPGRTLTADEDETGTSPGLERLRWGVIVRDEGSCDLLGAGRPVERLRSLGETSPPASPDGEDVAGQRDVRPLVAWIAGTFVVLGATAYLVLRRRSPR
ncbi:MAG: hypothetical protein ACRDGK_06455 [Actinomycetota bacterium]